MGEPIRVVVERWLSAVASGDAAAAADALSTQVRLHGAGTEVTGQTALNFAFRSLKEAFPDLQIETEILTAEMPWGIARFKTKGTQQSEIFGVPAGPVRELTGICCVSVGDQGISDVWLYLDAGQFVQQFGLRPAQAAPAAAATPAPAESWRDRIGGSARDVWLAGLGALVAAGEQGEKVFHTLVEQGRRLEESWRQSPTPSVEEVEAKPGGVAERARRMASTGQEYIRDVATTIRGRLDLPTREEFEELRRKIEQLSARVEPSVGAGPASEVEHPAGPTVTA